ncbi:hypothetical protein SDC9_175495 [bioreactor metagenome]|uniref:Uncharacterized protein n=1 Tax=bioreactor metagenome TaxID=1076179 RepID=A0A645GPE8_9ZZZZ
MALPFHGERRAVRIAVKAAVRAGVVPADVDAADAVAERALTRIFPARRILPADRLHPVRADAGGRGKGDSRFRAGFQPDSRLAPDGFQLFRQRVPLFGRRVVKPGPDGVPDGSGVEVEKADDAAAGGVAQSVGEFPKAA